MAGIFAASLFLVGMNWLFTVLPNTAMRGTGRSNGYEMGSYSQWMLTA